MDHASPVREQLPSSDPPLRITQVWHAPASYISEGQGPVLLLIHGLPGSTRDWRYLTPHLRGVRALRVDLPGFGASSRRDRTHWSVEERVEWLVALLDALNIERVTAVGHSMGGAVAVALAALAPSRVSRLALLCSPGLRPHAMFERSRMPQMSAWTRYRLGRWLLTKPLRKGFVEAGFSSKISDQQLHYTVADAGALSFEDHRARVEALRVPTLVAWTEDDRLIETPISEELAEACPPGPRLRWPTGGHNPQKHRAVELAAALSAWANPAESST